MLLEYDILHGDVPAIYELGVGEAGKSLIVTVHSSAMNYVGYELAGSSAKQRVDGLGQEMGLSTFILPTESENGWGFGEVLKAQGVDKVGWRSWECCLPRARDPMSQDIKGLHDTSASLSVFFGVLNMIEENSGCRLPQLLSVRLTDSRGSFPISSILSRAMMPWINLQPDNKNHLRIQEQMKEAFCRMMGIEGDYFVSQFKARFTPPKVVLSCGLASGLSPTELDPKSEEGYELSSSNVDGPIQQLTLLMGLAAMHDEVRFAGY